MKVQFPYVIRLTNRVADAVAREIVEQTGGGKYIPNLLSIRGTNESPVFHYEGGIVVQPHMLDLSQYAPPWEREVSDWVVMEVTTRYYPEMGKIIPPKVEELWSAERLRELYEKRWWHHPRILGREEVMGSIAVYRFLQGGRVVVDPEIDDIFTSGETPREWFQYHRFIPGDRERVEAEAKKKLDELLQR